MRLLLAIAPVLAGTPANQGTWILQLPKHSTECFTEKLAHGDRMEVGFQVIADDSPIDLAVSNPDGTSLHKVDKESAAAFGFNAGLDGAYTLCLINKAHSTDKVLTLTLTAPDEMSQLVVPQDYTSLFV